MIMQTEYRKLRIVLLLLPLLWFIAGCSGTRPVITVSEGLTVKETENGTILRMRLKSSPFPHVSRSLGYQYEDLFFPANPHYVNSDVAVFIPKNYRLRHASDLVVFLHGWYATIDSAAEQFSLYSQFANSGANALLILPEGPWNAADSSGGKFEERGGFEAFVRELAGQLTKAGVIRKGNIGSIVLAGHSGAYHAISEILANGDLDRKIREVMLFDALFGNLRYFDEWIASRKGRFIALYSGEGETAAYTSELMTMLRSDRLAFVLVDDDPKADRKMGRGKRVFVRSGFDHYGILYLAKEFERVLSKSSVLRHNG